MDVWMEGRTDDVEGRALARPYPVLTVLLVLSRHAMPGHQRQLMWNLECKVLRCTVGRVVRSTVQYSTALPVLTQKYM